MSTGKLYTIAIHCARCQFHLYTYQKEGPGALVKCYADRITENNAGGTLNCPSCKQEFARHAVIHNRPAHKLIRGKIFTKGHYKK